SRLGASRSAISGHVCLLSDPAMEAPRPRNPSGEGWASFHRERAARVRPVQYQQVRSPAGQVADPLGPAALRPGHRAARGAGLPRPDGRGRLMADGHGGEAEPARLSAEEWRSMAEAYEHSV